MRFLQPIYCLFGKHRRSRGHARSDGASFRSRCTGCGKPMIRAADGWHIDTGPSPPDTP